jgi:hypothetical protein
MVPSNPGPDNPGEPTEGLEVMAGSSDAVLRFRAASGADAGSLSPSCAWLSPFGNMKDDYNV